VEDDQGRCMLDVPNSEGTCVIDLSKLVERADIDERMVRANRDESCRGTSGHEECRNTE
jgi:hypothetical protein